MALLTPDTGLLIWMVIIFAAVFFLLAKFGFPIITGSIDRRNDRIRESLRLAKEAEERLASLSREQQAMIEQARVEQGRIIKEATTARDQIIAQAKDQASEEASRILQQAKTEIAAEKESAMSDLRNQVADLSVQVAEKIIRKNLELQANQQSLIDTYFDEALSDKKE